MDLNLSSDSLATVTANLQTMTREALATALRASAAEMSQDSRIDAFAIWDSLTALAVLMELERKVNVQVDAVALFNCQTVCDVETLVAATVAGGPVVGEDV